MNTATKRTIIATAALAAAGLFGSLPYDAASVAQQGVPTVHRDVALVDVTDATLLLDETTYDAAFLQDGVASETTLYSDLSTAYGTPAANTLLDTTTGGIGDFNGAETAGGGGFYLDGLVSEDQLNQLAGVTETASQTAILADFVAAGGSVADTTELTSAIGTSAFDTDLTSFANADYSLALTDFEGYLTAFSADPSGLSDLGTLLTDYSSSFSDLSNLSTDFSTLLTDLGSLF